MYVCLYAYMYAYVYDFVCIFVCMCMFVYVVGMCIYIYIIHTYVCVRITLLYIIHRGEACELTGPSLHSSAPEPPIIMAIIGFDIIIIIMGLVTPQRGLRGWEERTQEMAS